MVNKVARTRLFSYVRAMKNMEVQDMSKDIHYRFNSAIVYMLALHDAKLISNEVRSRLLFVITDVYQNQMQVFMIL